MSKKKHHTINKTAFITRIKRLIQLYRLKLLNIRATPHQIALGFTCGVFAAFVPIFPVQIILALFLAIVFKASKPAAAIGTFISNPLNTIPLHMLYYQIGKRLVPFSAPAFSFAQIQFTDFFNVGWKLYATLSLGAICLAIPCSITGYFIILKGTETYRKRRLERIKKKSEPTENKPR